MPKLAERVDPGIGTSPASSRPRRLRLRTRRLPHRWGDYEVGEKIDHVDGMTLEEAEHQIATRLYQNTANMHFNQHPRPRPLRQAHHLRRRVISLARALSFNGLDNAFHLAAINGGRHVAPFCGRYGVRLVGGPGEGGLPGRADVGALRTRLVAVKNRDCSDFPLKNDEGEYAEGVLLDLDAWVVLPR